MDPEYRLALGSLKSPIWQGMWPCVVLWLMDTKSVNRYPYCIDQNQDLEVMETMLVPLDELLVTHSGAVGFCLFGCCLIVSWFLLLWRCPFITKEPRGWSFGYRSNDRRRRRRHPHRTWAKTPGRLRVTSLLLLKCAGPLTRTLQIYNIKNGVISPGDSGTSLYRRHRQTNFKRISQKL